MSGSVFDAYAAYYDLLNRDKDYFAEATYVDSLLRSHRPDSSSLLELGCGTGLHAGHLSRLGYRVTGIDRSAAMVDLAQQRRHGLPPDVAQRLEFMAGDACTVRVGRTFDAVVSLFHVFSYQTSNEGLRNLFATAAAHLRPGGLLCFDYWYGPAVLTQRPEVRVRRMEDERCYVRRIAEPQWIPVANRVRVDYSIEVRSKSDESRSEFTEAHEMRYLFIPEIELLMGGDFRVLQHAAWMASSLPTLTDWAAVCVLERTG